MIVTICVVTYNSSQFIVETLESIYNQSYPKLALVISDDFSTDQTVTIVNNWVNEEHVKNRFQSIQIITIPKNTGVSANCNRCIAAVETKWFKFIAGDDILLPNCIDDNINFVNENPTAKIIFSQIRIYNEEFQNENFVHSTPDEYPKNIMDDNFTAKDQYHLLLLSDRIHYTPSFFSNKEAIVNVGGYEENNTLVEDYPMWLKLTSSGERLYYFHKETVGYRIHSKATNNVGENFIFKPSIFNSFAIRNKFAYPFLPWEIVQSEKFVYKVSKFFQYVNWNHNTKILVFLYKFMSIFCNPFHYIYGLKKRLPFTKNSIFYR